jgi:hypothetical protein
MQVHIFQQEFCNQVSASTVRAAGATLATTPSRCTGSASKMKFDLLISIP